MKLFISSILIFLLLSITGCSTNTSTNTPLPTQMPVEIELSFPNGAPPLNQTAILNCIITNHEIISKNISINVNLPDSFELESGSLSWNGTIPAKGMVTVIESVVKSVQVGNWSINATGYITIEPGTHGGNFYIPIYISVTEETAEWGKYPPWITPFTPVDTENRPPPPPTHT